MQKFQNRKIEVYNYEWQLEIRNILCLKNMFTVLTFNPDIGQNVPSGRGIFSQALAPIKLKVIIAKIGFNILDYDLV